MQRLRDVLRLSNSGKLTVDPESTLEAGFFGRFPPVFSVHFAWRSDDDKSFVFFIKDETTDTAERLYAFAVSRRRARNSLTLYAGTDPETSPVLALAGKDKNSRSTSIITLPREVTPDSTDEYDIKRLDNKGKLKTLSELFHFRMPVAGTGIKEDFEWRGGSVLENRRVSERKLIRMRESTGSGETEEVVGVWNDETPSSMRGNKLGTFQFLGSGSTGELGPAWALMAVVTLLRILEINGAGPEALAAMSSGLGGKILGPGVI
jgi:hypothetical protein